MLIKTTIMNDGLHDEQVAFAVSKGGFHSDR